MTLRVSEGIARSLALLVVAWFAGSTIAAPKPAEASPQQAAPSLPAEAAPSLPAEAAPSLPPEVALGLPPKLALNPGWYARINTSKGMFIVRLLPEQAPQSVAHFAALAEGRLPWVNPFTGETKNTRYYDGVTVHLVESAQRFEAGDRTGTGRGAPPMYVQPEGKGPITFDKAGRLGMTRSALDRVSAVQFFVTAIGTPWLRGHHPCFGEIVNGLDTVQAIVGVKTGPGKKPLEPVTIESVRIHRVGDVPPLAQPVSYRPKAPVFGPKTDAPK